MINNEKKGQEIISKKQFSHRCLVGDFNFPDINWKHWTTNHDENSKEVRFIETLRDCYMFQHNDQYTRRRGNDNPSLIDLILTDEALQVSQITQHSPLGKSDHNVITFTFNCYLDFSKPKEMFAYDKADYEAMKKDLTETEWTENFTLSVTSKNTNELWNDLKTKLNTLRDKFVPVKMISDKSTWKEGSFPINKDVQNAIRKKHSTHRRWMATRNRNDAEQKRIEYAKARNKVSKLMRKAKRNFEKDIATKCKTNPKTFWSHVRRKLKTRSGVAPLLEDTRDKSSMKYLDSDKAKILQQQFSSVFTK